MTKENLIKARQRLETTELMIKHEKEWADYWHDQSRPSLAYPHELRAERLQLDKQILEWELLHGRH